MLRVGSSLESFLWSIPTKKSIAIASPADIVNFLVWRDSFGKTVCHSDSCTAADNYPFREGLT